MSKTFCVYETYKIDEPHKNYIGKSSLERINTKMDTIIYLLEVRVGNLAQNAQTLLQLIGVECGTTRQEKK